MSDFKPNPLTHKLMVTIVPKGMAAKVVKAAKAAGAEGATILYGRGVGIHERSSFLGFPIEPEKEIILTLVPENKLEQVLDAEVEEGKLHRPGTGVGFVIDTLRIAGAAHLAGSCEADGMERRKETKEAMNEEISYDLIVTIVNKGMSDVVVDATKRAGAEGGTVLFGRGTGIHEHAKLFSIQIEPEKELVLTLIDKRKTNRVLEAILEDADLNKPSKGIAFVLPVERAVGINHPVRENE